MHAHSPQPEEKQPTSGISGHGSPDGTTKVFPTDLYDDGYSDPVYRAKARILNNSIQEIGMGKYQVSGERVFRSYHLFESSATSVVPIFRGWLWVVRVSLCLLFRTSGVKLADHSQRQCSACTYSLEKMMFNT